MDSERLVDGAWPTLPIDIIHAIMGLIAREAVNESLVEHIGSAMQTLQQCAMVCRTWNHLCRPHIWSRLSIDIAVDSPLPSISSRVFAQIIGRDKDIGSYVRDLVYNVRYHVGVQSQLAKSKCEYWHLPSELFLCMTNVRSFKLLVHPSTSMSKDPLDLPNDGIAHIVSLPTLTNLRLDLKYNRISTPFHLFLKNPSVKNLHIWYLPTTTRIAEYCTPPSIQLSEFTFFGPLPSLRILFPALDLSVLDNLAINVGTEIHGYQPLVAQLGKLRKMSLKSEIWTDSFKFITKSTCRSYH